MDLCIIHGSWFQVTLRRFIALSFFGDFKGFCFGFNIVHKMENGIISNSAKAFKVLF